MSRFLDQIRKAKEAQERAAAERRGEKPPQSAPPAEPDRLLVPDAHRPPSPPPEPRRDSGQPLYPAALERKDQPKEPEPTPTVRREPLYPGDLERADQTKEPEPTLEAESLVDFGDLYPTGLAETSESGPRTAAEKTGVPPSPAGEGLVPDALANRRYGEERKPPIEAAAETDRQILVPESLAEKRPSPAPPQAPQEPEPPRPLVPESLAEKRPSPPPPQAPQEPEPPRPLVPESLAEKRPSPPPLQTPQEPEPPRPLVPESLAEKRPFPPPPQAPQEPEPPLPLVPESSVEKRPPPPPPQAPPAPEKPLFQAPMPPVEERPIPPPPPPPVSEIPERVREPLPSIAREATPMQPAPPKPIPSPPGLFDSGPVGPSLATPPSEERKPPIPMAAPDTRGESREGPKMPKPSRQLPEEDLFPKELEVHPHAEDEGFEEQKASAGFPSEERIPSPPPPRPAGTSSGERPGRADRRRSRREIAISGPEVDPDFVRRVAKIAMRPDTRVVAYYRPKHNVCEEYRLLGKNILHTFNGATAGSPRGRIVTMTSSVRNEGKTLTCVNLAMTLAQDFKDRVLLLDGDMRHPRVHTYIGSAAGTGLNDLLASSDPASILEDCLLRTDMGLHLLLASSSRGNPAPLLDSRQSTQLFNLLRERYALVIVDTPPVLLATDALTVGLKSDGMLFLIRAGKTKREQIQEARQRIARLDIRMLGYVMNKVRTFLPKIWQERFYYYGHY